MPRLVRMTARVACARTGAVDLWQQAQVLVQLARAGWTAFWHDTNYPSPVPENPRFMSPRAAVDLIADGNVVAVSGLGGNQRASILFWAIREAFERTGRPAGLTIINLGGHGGRGQAPGTLEELGQRGLCRRLVAGHMETFRAMLALAADGHCELQCIPQGTLALLIEAQGRGERSLVSDTGVGTFVDPRIGSGSPVGGTGEQLITVEEDRLRYRIPAIDVAIFNAPAADREGNIYVKHAAMIGETAEIARAARKNGGRVIANVGLIVEPGYDRVFLPADMVDAIAYHPDTEQAAAIPHRDYWPALTTEAHAPIAESMERAAFVNWIIGVTARRNAVHDAVARLAVTTLAASVRAGARVNIGIGLPEHACQMLFAAGLHERITLLVESGPLGGLPAPGAYFGAAFSPEKILSSAEMFRLTYERLDATCLGVLEADGTGSVNVSRRSNSVADYVGPGGFIDLTTAAGTIVFVSGWMVGGAMDVEDGKVRLRRRGVPKFVERVREITFNGPRALTAGKRVFFATPVGLFQLTSRGMELTQVMPGIDIRNDILDVATMPIVLPDTGTVPLAPRGIVTGTDFAPRIAD